jgi:cytochrome P450
MHLATHPHYMAAIRAEYKENAQTYDCQRPLPLLEAFIQESMRLTPSVFFGSQRVIPPQGLEISGHFIPGNTIVHIPLYPLFRDPRNFVQPDTFIPERWTSKPDLVLNRNVFIPFSTGSYSCAGKALAMMELRSVVARVVGEFDVVLDEGTDISAYWEGIMDHFTAGPQPMMVRFVRAQ